MLSVICVRINVIQLPLEAKISPHLPSVSGHWRRLLQGASNVHGAVRQWGIRTVKLTSPWVAFIGLAVWKMLVNGKMVTAGKNLL